MAASSKTPRPVILGPNGQPAARFLYPSPRLNLQKYKPRYILATSTKKNVTEYDRFELVNYSRQLVSQIGDLGTAITQKNSWAFLDSWDPHFAGDNKAWGEEAEQFLVRQFYPNCNVRGPLFHFRATNFTSGVAFDRDGDDLEVYTEREDHFPQVAIFPSTRVCSGYSSANSGEDVKGGPFDGAKIFDGVIINRSGKAVGVRVVDEDGEWHTDISLFNCDLAYEPEWSDQRRGIPKPSVCLLRWMNLQDIDDFLQSAMKRAATMQLQRLTTEGEGVQGNEIITGEEQVQLPDGTTETRPIQVERIGGGDDIIELSAADGEEIKVLDYKNPHPNSEAYIERIKRECLTSVGWYYELLNVHSTGRAPTRMVAKLANKSIWYRQATMERRALRRVCYAITKAQQHGFISRNPDQADALKWQFGMPAEISIDEGNDALAAREAIKMNLSSRHIECQKQGFREEDVLSQNSSSLDAITAEAFKLKEKWGLPVEFWIERLDQRSPNPMVMKSGGGGGGQQQNNQQQQSSSAQK